MFKNFEIIRNGKLTPKGDVIKNGWRGYYKDQLYGNYLNVEVSDLVFIENAQGIYNALMKLLEIKN